MVNCRRLCYIILSVCTYYVYWKYYVMTYPSSLICYTDRLFFCSPHEVVQIIHNIICRFFKFLLIFIFEEEFSLSKQSVILNSISIFMNRCKNNTAILAEDKSFFNKTSKSYILCRNRKILNYSILCIDG